MKPHAPDSHDPNALIRADLSAFARTWGIPTLPARVTVHYSTRLRSSLGRCTPARGEVRLAAALATRDPDLHREVLCHEVAHVAVHIIHGPGCRPRPPLAVPRHARRRRRLL